jgi:hypothetical protein
MLLGDMKANENAHHSHFAPIEGLFSEELENVEIRRVY